MRSGAKERANDGNDEDHPGEQQQDFWDIIQEEGQCLAKVGVGCQTKRLIGDPICQWLNGVIGKDPKESSECNECNEPLGSVATAGR